ncbi:hypothetical protein ABB05_13965 [Lederbergia galactosidilytica]|uniref:Uncharacterized protein n=1 Tax=Lederbergia galactosidilytica TaxID=217031 RepID=A0A177ZMN9_9BACI|nr:hypothetical protein ABB05_13965 [Lederbergia galactosidilytica]
MKGALFTKNLRLDGQGSFLFTTVETFLSIRVEGQHARRKCDMRVYQRHIRRELDKELTKNIHEGMLTTQTWKSLKQVSLYIR